MKSTLDHLDSPEICRMVIGQLTSSESRISRKDGTLFQTSSFPWVFCPGMCRMPNLISGRVVIVAGSRAYFSEISRSSLSYYLVGFVNTRTSCSCVHQALTKFTRSAVSTSATIILGFTGIGMLFIPARTQASGCFGLPIGYGTTRRRFSSLCVGDFSH